MENSKNKNMIFNLLLILVISFVVIYLLINNNFNEMLPLIKNIRSEYLLLCLIITFLWQLLIGISLTIFSRIIKKDYRLSQGFLNALVATLFNGITPSATGGQIAQTFVFKKQGLQTGDAISVLWTEFIMYQSTMCLFGLFLIIIKLKFFLTEYSNLFILVILGFILNSAVIVGLIALAKFYKLQNFISTKGIDFAYKLHLIKDKEKAIESMNEQLNNFRKEANTLLHHKKEFIICCLLCVLRLTCYYSIPFIVFIALGNKASLDIFINCLAMGSFVAIASNLIPIPGASGGTELIFIEMFAHLFGAINAKTAVLLWRFFTYYLLLLVGFIAYTYYKFKEN